MWRTFWTVAFAFLFLACLASVADAQRRPDSNRKAPAGVQQPGNPNSGSTQGNNPGNGHQNDPPGNGNQGEDPPGGGGTPDGETPAQEDICDGLQNATPGLYGLCIAFCEAHDCEPVWDDENNLDFSSCKKSDRKILNNYRRKMRNDDPDMPCLPSVIADEEPATACPCWSLEQLSNFPYGTYGWDIASSDRFCELDAHRTDRGGCTLDSDYVGESIFMSDGTGVAIDLSVTANDCGTRECTGYFGCNPEEGCPEWLPVSSVYRLDLTEEEYLNCRDQLLQLEPYCY